MRSMMLTFFQVAWALWLGGTVATLLFVQHLFSHDRELALTTAPELFLVFEKYQLALAVVCAVGVIGVRRRSAVVIALVLIAVVIALTSAFVITPAIDHLRLAGQSQTPAFRRLHGLSMLAYLVNVLVLLAVGVVLAWRTGACVQASAEVGSRTER